MPTLYSLTSTTALANLRIDLNDTDSTQYRWQDTQLNRAIDRANERLSDVDPLYATTQLQPVKDAVLYAVPAGALFIDRVEYPQGQWPPTYPQFTVKKSPSLLAPLAALTASLGSGGALGAGAYQWAYTFTTPGGGETVPSPAVTLTATLNQSATLAVPLGGYGVTGRNVYRTIAGGSQLKLGATLPDNTSTIYTDTAADGALGANAPTSNTTGGTDIFELLLAPEKRPPDTTRFIIEVRYAQKHQLDTTGTTLPERHWDTLYKGAMAFAAEIYLTSVNDNFEYADGQLRDRVDDTKSIDAWRSYRDVLLQDFNQRLTRIRNEVNAGVSTTNAYWGDKPIRYERV